jgi:SagB-type dehydrogenase family enzyme
LEEISFLLWATQGVQKKRADGFSSFRTVPSGGARHPFETYLAVIRIRGLQTGLYRYLTLTHQLCLLRPDPDPGPKVTEACRGQGFAGRAAAVFIWAAVPYRSEWRYGILAAKLVALEAGHLCQNLYLASEAIGAGTCAIGAYDQDKMDSLLGLDGKEEFAVYVAPVGKIG